MEDTELQKLFDAKRTVEANRRRQEELRKLMAASAPKTRRLWPLWTLSAAASLVLLLITLPMLFHSETAEPLLVAEVKKPVTVEPTKSKESLIPKNLKTCKSLKPLKSLRNLEAFETLNSPEPTTEIASAEEPILISEPNPMDKEESEEIFDEGPRIHRRTSTQMVCSNCKIDNIPSPSTAIQDFLAASFGTATNTPLTLKTIEF